MNEITRVILENEMDLILAHKQSMKLAECTGLTLAAQTSFATAVSEVCRSVVGKVKETTLILYVSDQKEKQKFISAVLENKRVDVFSAKDEGYNYAKRLVSNIQLSQTDNGTRVELRYRLPLHARIDDLLIEKWSILLNADPAISPYEEIKRKNRQLVEMADKLRESELQYKSLTDSLPIMIFSLDHQGHVTYGNQWITDYSGLTIDEINNTRWQTMVHPQDYEHNMKTWEKWRAQAGMPGSVIIPEQRIKNALTGEYRWHTGISIAITEEDGSVKCWNNFLVDVHAQKMIAQTLQDNVELKQTKAELENNVALLNKSNHQLEQFAYAASHDLQEPLRKISFYSDFISNKFSNALPQEASFFFNNLLKAAERMRNLINDILSYSIIQKDEFATLNLNSVAKEMIDDMEVTITEKNAIVEMDELPVIEGNPRQIKQLFENIISNALKFHKPDTVPYMAIKSAVENGEAVIRFEDRGIGFDEQYVDKMFSLFQQLNPRDMYKGTGIGLALCKKIVDFHHGSITAKGTPGDGAIFEIRLPVNQSQYYNN